MRSRYPTMITVACPFRQTMQVHLLLTYRDKTG
jgi:hypothetical protein